MSDRGNIAAPGLSTEELAADIAKQGNLRPRRRKLRRRNIMFALVILAALMIGSGLILLPPEVSVYEVSRRDLVQTVVASGHIESPYRVNIGSQITGTVAEVPVEEGQAVKAGQMLLRLDDHEYSGAVIQAQASVAQAEAHLRQIREVLLPSAQQTWRQAEATAVNARSSYARALRLLSDGYTTQANYDVVRRDRDIAELVVRNAALQVTTNSPGGSDYVMAESQLAQSNAGLKTAEAKEGYTIITAPIDGRLILRNVERGNVVTPSDTLLVLAPKGEIRIDLQIDERDLGLLKVGQTAIASADAYPGATFTAVLSYINPGVDIQQASVLVKLRVTDPPSYLVQDMTVSAEIEVGRRQAGLVLPVVAVHDIKGRAPWVLAVEKGRLVRRAVTIGMQADEFAEVTDGLAAGALVIPASDASRVPGERVHPAIISIPGQ